MATVVGDLLVKLRGDTRDFEKSMARADKRLKAMGKKMQGVGQSMTMGLSLPLLGVGTAAVKMSSDLDMTLSRIVGLVGESRQDVAAWREELIKLGPTVGKSTNELAEALFFITSAGIKGERAMKAVRAAAMGASAGLGDTAVVADAATSAMNAYATSGLSATQATAVLVSTVREGKAEASALAPVLGAIMPIAAQLGVSFDQVGASMAAMTRIGLDASIAATALRATLSQVAKVTPKQEKAAAALGLSFKQLRQVIREDGLIAGLMLLKERIGDNETAMTEIFPNIRALTGVLGMVGENAASTEAIFKRMAATTGEDLLNAFEAVEEQAGFKFKQALISLQNVLIRIGDDVLPALVPKVEELTVKLMAASTAWKDLDASTKKWTLTLGGLGIVLGPVAAGLGFMTMGIGALVGTIGKLGALTAAVWGTYSAFMGLVTAGTSVTAAIGLSGGMVAALVVLFGLLGGAIGTIIKPFVQELLNLDEAFGLIANKSQDIADGMADNQEQWDNAYDAYQKMRKQLNLTGKEWQIANDRTFVNAQRLSDLTERAIQLAKKKSELKAKLREMNDEWVKNKDVAVDAADAEANAIGKATEAEAAHLAELKKKYEVLSKDDIKKQMEGLAADFHDMKDTIDKTQLAEKFNEPMLKIAKLAKENGVAIPKPFAEAANHLEDKVIPGLQNVILTTTQIGGNFKTQGKVLEGVFTHASEQVGFKLEGGFKQGVDRGIQHGTVAMDRWVQRLENDVIYIPVQPNFDAWNKAVDDYVTGQVPDTGG